MLPSEDKKKPERKSSAFTNDELLKDIADALEKPAEPSTECLAEHLDQTKDTKTVIVSVVTSYWEGAPATCDNIGRIVFQFDESPILVTRRGHDIDVIPTLLNYIQSEMEQGAICGRIPSDTVEHFWELVDENEVRNSRSSKTP